MVVLAFAIVYIVWGSTYFFIQKAVYEFPPFIMGALRFLIAGAAMLIWCMIRREKIWNWQIIKHATISGLLLLLIGNGAVIWAEQTLPSSLVAILVSAAPIWFVLLDRPHWRENFHSRETLTGLIIGFIGVVLLFFQQLMETFGETNGNVHVISLIILIFGSISWARGSLYSKAKSVGSTMANTTWQMFTAGIAFLPFALFTGEMSRFKPFAISAGAWFSLFYLIIFGSLIAYSAYVWLLQVRPATQVSTYGYVNPVIAVLLGVFLGGEKMSWIQLLGLAIILISVLLINIAKARKEKKLMLKRKAESALVNNNAVILD